MIKFKEYMKPEDIYIKAALFIRCIQALIVDPIIDDNVGFIVSSV